MIALTAVAPLTAVDADRDFSGRWILDPQASNLEALSPQPAPLLAIAQREMAIRCAPGGGDGAAAPWSFSADGAESRYTLGTERRNTVAKWEGSALLVNTLVSGGGDYAIMDRWKLSQDRSILTIERRVVRAGVQAEGVMVYRREEQTELASRPSAQAARRAAETPQAPDAGEFQVRAGTRIPLSLINSVDTRHSHEGDRVYLETVFPVFASGCLVVPRGSYVI